MKTNLFLSIAILLGFSFYNVPVKTTVKILPKSSLVIKGSSNVNTFECEYENALLEDELVVLYSSKNSKIELERAQFKICSQGFDCCHQLITKDLRKTLKADAFSYITINVKEINRTNSEYSCSVAVEIAGKHKDYEIPICLSKNNNIKGTLKLNINDFDLKTPKKAFGLIAVKNTVEIDFDLYLAYN